MSILEEQLFVIIRGNFELVRFVNIDNLFVFGLGYEQSGELIALIVFVKFYNQKRVVEL